MKYQAMGGIAGVCGTNVHGGLIGVTKGGACIKGLPVNIGTAQGGGVGTVTTL